MKYVDINSEKEIWEDIYGYEGHYQVSNMGRVKSIKFFKCLNKRRNKLIYLNRHPSGYVTVRLKIMGVGKICSVHRLVSFAFIENNDKSRQLINHKNGIRHDNRVFNLEWVNKKENMKHSMEELGISRNGSFNPNSRYSESEIKEFKKLIFEGHTVYKACRIVGIKQSTAYAVANKKIRNNEIY